MAHLFHVKVNFVIFRNIEDLQLAHNASSYHEASFRVLFRVSPQIAQNRIMNGRVRAQNDGFADV